MRVTKRDELIALVSSIETDECVDFDSCKNGNGYPQVFFDRSAKLASRVSYAAANKIELSSMAGKVVRHSCDNPACVNPRHLLLGTQMDNVQDMITRGRKVNPSNISGENHHNSKLTFDQICEARRLHVKWDRNNGVSISALAKKYGVSRKAVSNALLGKSWNSDAESLVRNK